MLKLQIKHRARAHTGMNLSLTEFNCNQRINFENNVSAPNSNVFMEKRHIFKAKLESFAFSLPKTNLHYETVSCRYTSYVKTPWHFHMFKQEHLCNELFELWRKILFACGWSLTDKVVVWQQLIFWPDHRKMWLWNWVLFILNINPFYSHLCFKNAKDWLRLYVSKQYLSLSISLFSLQFPASQIVVWGSMNFSWQAHTHTPTHAMCYVS